MELSFDQEKQIRTAFEHADGLLITAGAGLGVDSGLPDFRGTEGFWRAYPSLAKSKLTFQDVASPSSFQRDPRQAWGFYGHRLNLYRSTQPHEGFQILKRIGELLPRKHFVMTSNVDGQFQKSGFDPDKIYEIHGSIHHLQCVNGCKSDIWPASDFKPQINEDKCQLLNDFPVCPHCGAIARPNILMFGDWSWQQTRTRLQGLRHHAWTQNVSTPVVIEIGAGKDIPTIRLLSERAGGTLIRINPRDCDVPLNGICLKLGSLEGLRLIERCLTI